MPLYQCQPPTGYKDTADAWANTGALVNRMNFALTLARRPARRRGDADARRRLGLAGDVSTRRAHDRAARHRRADGSRSRSARRNSRDGETSMIIATSLPARTARSPWSASGSLPRFSRGPRSPPAHGAPRSSSIAIFQRGAVDGLNMVVPVRRERLLPRPADHRDSAARRRDRRRARSRRLLRVPPAACAAQAVLGRAASWRSCTRAARPTPRARTSTRRTTWKRPRPASRARRTAG